MRFKWKDVTFCGYKDGKVGVIYDYPDLPGLKDVNFHLADNGVVITANVGAMAQEGLSAVTTKVRDSVQPVLDILTSSYKALYAKQLESKPVLKKEDVTISLSGSLITADVKLPESWNDETTMVELYTKDGVLHIRIDWVHAVDEKVKSTQTKIDDIGWGMVKYGIKMIFNKFGEDVPKNN